MNDDSEGSVRDLWAQRKKIEWLYEVVRVADRMKKIALDLRVFNGRFFHIPGAASNWTPRGT
jgi:hypothetical protein